MLPNCLKPHYVSQYFAAAHNHYKTPTPLSSPVRPHQAGHWLCSLTTPVENTCLKSNQRSSQRPSGPPDLVSGPEDHRPYGSQGESTTANRPVSRRRVSHW